MKVAVFVLVSLFLVSFVSGVSDECELSCGADKNDGLERVRALKDELKMCRPEFLECANMASDLSVCRSEYLDCKWGMTKEIKEKKIEINNEFSRCISDCSRAEDKEFESISVERKQVSGFCSSLMLARSEIVSHFSEDVFLSTLKMSGCGSFEKL